MFEKIAVNILYIGIGLSIITLIMNNIKLPLKVMLAIKEISYVFGTISIIMPFIGVVYILIHKSYPSQSILYYSVLLWLICGSIGMLTILLSLNEKIKDIG